MQQYGAIEVYSNAAAQNIHITSSGFLRTNATATHTHAIRKKGYDKYLLRYQNSTSNITCLIKMHIKWFYNILIAMTIFKDEAKTYKYLLAFFYIRILVRNKNIIYNYSMATWPFKYDFWDTNNCKKCTCKQSFGTMTNI